MNSAQLFELFSTGLVETIYMVFVSLIIAYIFGLPIGIILTITDKNSIAANKVFHKILATIINIARSLPFIILLIMLIPFTRALIGTFIGPTAVIVPLSIAAIPFVARLCEAHLSEVDKKVIEMLIVSGASNLTIIKKGYIGEALPALVKSVAITAIALVGYSAMAGAVGGGGLGDIAIRYGQQRYDYLVMMIAVVILIALVCGIQTVFDVLSKIINKQ